MSESEKISSKATASTEGAEQSASRYWLDKFGDTARGTVSWEFACSFAEDFAASLREQLAQAQTENDRLTDAFLVYETIQPDGSLRATLKDVLEGLDQAQFKVEVLKGSVKDWRTAYEQERQHLADMQKHRDSWREYAYGNREKPLDFQDGNKVNRGKTALEDAQRELEEARGLPDKWDTERASYPSTQLGIGANAAVKLCAKELRKALARSTGTKEGQ